MKQGTLLPKEEAPASEVHLVKGSLSLYDREQEWKQLEELLASDEGAEAANQEELVALVEKTFLAVQEKRDNFCAFLAWLEGQQALGEVEQERLEARIKRIKAARERLEKVAIGVIRSLGQDDKGKWKKLEGRTSTLQLNRNPASVEILDDTKVPDEFKEKTVTITFPATRHNAIPALMELENVIGARISSDPVVRIKTKAVAEALKEMLPCERCGQLGVIEEPAIGAGPTPEDSPMLMDRVSVCPDCHGAKQLPRQVPGARLVTDKVRLVRK